MIEWIANQFIRFNSFQTNQKENEDIEHLYTKVQIEIAEIITSNVSEIIDIMVKDEQFVFSDPIPHLMELSIIQNKINHCLITIENYKKITIILKPVIQTLSIFLLLFGGLIILSEDLNLIRLFIPFYSNVQLIQVILWLSSSLLIVLILTNLYYRILFTLSKNTIDKTYRSFSKEFVKDKYKSVSSEIINQNQQSNTQNVSNILKKHQKRESIGN
jgi:hypothetical protein